MSSIAEEAFKDVVDARHFQLVSKLLAIPGDLELEEGEIGWLSIDSLIYIISFVISVTCLFMTNKIYKISLLIGKITFLIVLLNYLEYTFYKDPTIN